MGLFDKFKSGDSYNDSPHAAVYEGKQHHSKWTHEVVAGAASYEAMKHFEKHEQGQGKAQNHQHAMEVIAGIAGAEVDKLFEAKGLNSLDRERTKRAAQEQAHRMLEQHEAGQLNY